MAGEQDRRAGIFAAFRSWRTGSVALQSFFSGLPLGLVLIAIPAWMARNGVDIRAIGILSLAQIPWTFKFAWSPLMDRFAPPLLGRKRGWAVVAQLGLVVSTLGLAWVAPDPSNVWLIGGLALLIAFAAATQDIAVDAYAVEVLRRDEQGSAVGARTALYRAAMYVAGAAAISLAGWRAAVSFPAGARTAVVPPAERAIYNGAWAQIIAVIGLSYLLGVALMFLSPEPEEKTVAPRSLRAAVWEPLVGLLRQHRALEILLFLFLYKLGDNLASALVRPFLVQAGYGDFDVGIATGTVGIVGTLVGTFIGGALTARLGLGYSLWVFGFAQAFSNFGYVVLAGSGPSSPLMYAALLIETGASGLGNGAFGVLLLRMTEKRFSATQYALLSSVFAIGRTVVGPMAGFLVDAMGWRPFFLLTFFAAIPGLACLHRFVPFGRREFEIAVEPPGAGVPVGYGALVGRALAGGTIGLAVGAVVSAGLEALKAYRKTPAAGFPLGAELLALLEPRGIAGWTASVGLLLFALVAGLGTAAMIAARRGIARG